MKILKISALVGATMVVATPAMAATLLIDDFTTAGTVSSNDGGNPATGPFSGSGILGGERFMWASSDDAPAPDGGTSLVATSGIINFSNSNANNASTPAFVGTGQAVLVYDGSGNTGAGTSEEFIFASTPSSLVGSADFPTATTASINVNRTGLGSIDFLQGALATQRAIEFDFVSFSGLGELDFRAYAWDNSNRMVSFFEALKNPTTDSSNLNFSTFLGLSEFAGDAGFNWGEVGAIAFSVESITPQFDGVIASISVVPLPLSAFLLLGGLGGLAGVSAVSKRRRRA